MEEQHRSIGTQTVVIHLQKKGQAGCTFTLSEGI
jgi:hypothetical protein